METTGAEGKIHISESTYDKLPRENYYFEEKISEESPHANSPCDIQAHPFEEMRAASISMMKTYFVTKKEDAPEFVNPIANEEETPRLDNLDKEEELFKSRSKMHRLSLKFTHPRLEEIYRKYFFQNSLNKSRVFILMGLGIHLMFGFLDLITDIKSIEQTWWIYYPIVVPIILTVFGLSYTKSEWIFTKATAIMTLLFGVGTLAELILSTAPVLDFAISRVCVVFLFVTVFYPLSLVSVIVVSLSLFIILNMVAFTHEHLKAAIFSTDFIGLVMLLFLILFSIYIMEKEVRKSFVLKRRVRYKGTVLTHEQKKAEQLLLNILPAPTAEKLKEISSSQRGLTNLFIADSHKEVHFYKHLLETPSSIHCDECIEMCIGWMHVCESAWR